MTIEKLELMFTGGLAMLEIRKPSESGATKNTEGALSLTTAERTNILPCTRSYESPPGEHYEVESFLWEAHQPAGIYQIVIKPESFSHAFFNKIVRRLIWLSLWTWGRLSMEQMLNSIATNGNKGPEASLAGILSRAVDLGLLEKTGKGIKAVYKIRPECDEKELSYRLPFRPTRETKQTVRERAKPGAGTHV